MAQEYVVYTVPTWNSWNKIKQPVYPQVHYLLQLPDKEDPDFQRQRQAFREFFLSRCPKMSQRGRYFYHAMDQKEWVRGQNMWGDVLARHGKVHVAPQLSAVFVGIWDLFQHLGFDYRTKKFVSAAS